MSGWSKSIVRWRCGETLYLSVPFTWLLDEAEGIASQHKGKVVTGGPAVKLMGAPWAHETPDTTPFDVLAMHNPLATYTSRGCPNHCLFCAVPKLEGALRELPTWKRNPVICDNNLLATSRRHFELVIHSLRPFPACDLQGLEAARLTMWHIEHLRRLHRPVLRFGFDRAAQRRSVQRAVERCLAAGLPARQIRVYVLIGYDDTPDDARGRLELVREWGALPFAQRYQPLTARRKNEYVAASWTPYEMARMVRYYCRLIHLGHIPYEEYSPVAADLFAEAAR